MNSIFKFFSIWHACQVAPLMINWLLMSVFRKKMKVSNVISVENILHSTHYLKMSYKSVPIIWWQRCLFAIGESCWWTIHPSSKQRSEGEKVRVGDDAILVSVATERYLVNLQLLICFIENPEFITCWNEIETRLFKNFLTASYKRRWQGYC